MLLQLNTDLTKISQYLGKIHHQEMKNDIDKAYNSFAIIQENCKELSEIIEALKDIEEVLTSCFVNPLGWNPSNTKISIVCINALNRLAVYHAYGTSMSQKIVNFLFKYNCLEKLHFHNNTVLLKVMQLLVSFASQSGTTCPLHEDYLNKNLVVAFRIYSSKLPGLKKPSEASLRQLFGMIMDNSWTLWKLKYRETKISGEKLEKNTTKAETAEEQQDIDNCMESLDKTKRVQGNSSSSSSSSSLSLSSLIQHVECGDQENKFNEIDKVPSNNTINNDENNIITINSDFPASDGREDGGFFCEKDNDQVNDSESYNTNKSSYDDKNTVSALDECELSLLDGTRFLKDICYLSMQSPAVWLPLESLDIDFCLEFLEEFLTHHFELAQNVPDYIYIVKDRICPLIISLFSDNRQDMAFYSRFLRVSTAFVNRFQVQYPMTCVKILEYLREGLEISENFKKQLLNLDALRIMSRDSDTTLFSSLLIENVCLKPQLVDAVIKLVNKFGKFVSSIADKWDFSEFVLTQNLPLLIDQYVHVENASVNPSSTHACSTILLILMGLVNLLKISMNNQNNNQNADHENEVLNNISTYNSVPSSINKFFDGVWASILNSLAIIFVKTLDDATMQACLKTLQNFAYTVCNTEKWINVRDYILNFLAKVALPNKQLALEFNKSNHGSRFSNSNSARSSPNNPYLSLFHSKSVGSDNSIQESLTYTDLEIMSILEEGEYSIYHLTRKNVFMIKILLNIAHSTANYINSSWPFFIHFIGHINGILHAARKNAVDQKNSDSSSKNHIAESNSNGESSDSTKKLFVSNFYSNDSPLKTFHIGEWASFEEYGMLCDSLDTLFNSSLTKDCFIDNGFRVLGMALLEYSKTQLNQITASISISPHMLFGVNYLFILLKNNLFRISLLWENIHLHLLEICNHSNSTVRLKSVTEACELIELGIALLSTEPYASMNTNEITKISLLLMQVRLLETIEAIFSTTQYQAIRHVVLDSIYKIITTYGPCLSSGWRIILAILLNIGVSHEKPLIPLGFRSVQVIINEYLNSVPFDCIPIIISTIGNYASKWIENTNVSISAIGLLWNVSDFIAEKRDIILEKATEVEEANLRNKGYEPESLISQIIKEEEYKNVNSNNFGKNSVKTKQPESIGKQQYDRFNFKQKNSPDIHNYVDSLWLSLFQALDTRIRNDERDIRDVAIQTLYRILVAHGALVSSSAWATIIEKLLLPSLDWVKRKLDKVLETTSTLTIFPEENPNKSHEFGSKVTSSLSYINYSKNNLAQEWFETQRLILSCFGNFLNVFLGLLFTKLPIELLKKVQTDFLDYSHSLAYVPNIDISLVSVTTLNNVLKSTYTTIEKIISENENAEFNNNDNSDTTIREWPIYKNKVVIPARNSEICSFYNSNSDNEKKISPTKDPDNSNESPDEYYDSIIIQNIKIILNFQLKCWKTLKSIILYFSETPHAIPYQRLTSIILQTYIEFENFLIQKRMPVTHLEGLFNIVSLIPKIPIDLAGEFLVLRNLVFPFVRRIYDSQMDSKMYRLKMLPQIASILLEWASYSLRCSHKSIYSREMVIESTNKSHEATINDNNNNNNNNNNSGNNIEINSCNKKMNNFDNINSNRFLGNPLSQNYFCLTFYSLVALLELWSILLNADSLEEHAKSKGNATPSKNNQDDVIINQKKSFSIQKLTEVKFSETSNTFSGNNADIAIENSEKLEMNGNQQNSFSDKNNVVNLSKEQGNGSDIVDEIIENTDKIDEENKTNAVQTNATKSDDSTKNNEKAADNKSNSEKNYPQDRILNSDKVSLISGSKKKNQFTPDPSQSDPNDLYKKTRSEKELGLSTFKTSNYDAIAKYYSSIFNVKDFETLEPINFKEFDPEWIKEHPKTSELIQTIFPDMIIVLGMLIQIKHLKPTSKIWPLAIKLFISTTKISLPLISYLSNQKECDYSCKKKISIRQADYIWKYVIKSMESYILTESFGYEENLISSEYVQKSEKQFLVLLTDHLFPYCPKKIDIINNIFSILTEGCEHLKREFLMKNCFTTLVELCKIQNSSKYAIPHLMNYSRSILSRFISEDKHSGALPLPVEKVMQIYFILKKLESLTIPNEFWPEKIKNDFLNSSQRRHIWELFPLFCDCITVKEPEIKYLLQKILHDCSKELGLEGRRPND